MEPKNKNIVWLASWYPSKVKSFDGDFIQRHAQACSQYNKIYVIHVVKDEKAAITQKVAIDHKENGNLTEVIVYYHIKPTIFSSINKLRSEMKYRRLLKDAILKYIKKNNLPDLIHVHTGIKAGSVGWWVKRKFSIPYVVTEHWTGFLDESENKLSGLPWYQRCLWKKILRNAHSISTVSQHLKKNIEKISLAVPVSVIPNVVDITIFKKNEDSFSNEIVFTHISNMRHYKNPTGILKAFQNIVVEYPSARLEMIGGGSEELLALSTMLGLSNHVNFYPEIPQKELAKFICKSNAVILYSHYETFGCVIIEANACGIPVLVSDIPAFHEIVNEGVNGMFVKTSSIETLSVAMRAIIEKKPKFDRVAIAQRATEKYSYAAIGKQFDEWYASQLS